MYSRCVDLKPDAVSVNLSRMKIRLASILVLGSFVVGCSSESSTGTTSDSGVASDSSVTNDLDSAAVNDAGTGGDPEAAVTESCATTTNVSDGPTTDQDIMAGATSMTCYYAKPSEGYCRKITDSASIANYVSGKDKGAVGCKDAVILSGECPTKNAVGKCDANSIEAQRVYYSCSKFADPAAHCAQITGTYTAL